MCKEMLMTILNHYGTPKRLSRLLGVYAGVEPPRSKVDEMAVNIVSKLVSYIASRIGVSEDYLKGYLREPYMRRGLSSLILGLLMYGVTRPQRIYAPFMIVWDFTRRCNLKCAHCYASATPQGAPDELDLRGKLEVLRQIDEAGVAILALSGGEPLLSKDFWVIAKGASRAGILVSVATNGTLITRSIARRLKGVGVRYVEVSVDSPIPEVHDRFRGVKGAWDMAIRGIRNAKAEGLNVGIAFTVTKLNKDDVEELLRLAKELGVDVVVAFNFIPTGRGKSIVSLDLNPYERYEFLKRLYRAWRDLGLQVYSTAPMYSLVTIAGRSLVSHFLSFDDTKSFPVAPVAIAELIGGCGAGVTYMAIEANGDAQPCVFIPVKVGNVLRDGLLNIWHKSPILNELRDREHNYGCGGGRCSFKYICGGCRARAYAYHGDLKGPDPGCPLNIVKPHSNTHQSYN
jgi:radical SAM protein with 4Fe4S-binding SPASM domain